MARDGFCNGLLAQARIKDEKSTASRLWRSGKSRLRSSNVHYRIQGRILCENGWRHFGSALHTVQDSFSHTLNRNKGLPISSEEHAGTLVGLPGYLGFTAAWVLLYDWRHWDDPMFNWMGYQRAKWESYDELHDILKDYEEGPDMKDPDDPNCVILEGG